LVVFIVLARSSNAAEQSADRPNVSVAAVEPHVAAPANPASVPSAPAGAANEIQSLLHLGANLTQRSEFDSAEIAFRQVLNAPDVTPHQTKTALLGLARMHRKQGALTKATAIYERYLKDYPGDERTPDALLELGRTLRDLGVYRLAMERFYGVINSTLKLPTGEMDRYQVLAKTAQFEIAETHFLAGDFAEAAKYYSRLRLLDLSSRDRARAHFKAGHALRLQGDLENAVLTLRAYTEQWPDDENVPEARYFLAITLGELKRTQEAFAATLELLRAEKSRIATDPKRWAYWQRRTGNQLANHFYESGDTLNAQAIYSGLVELSSEPSWQMPVTYQLALCYERLGLPDRARLLYEAIVATGGQNPPADLAELARMAAWRIQHLDWRDRVGHQLSAILESNTGKQAATPAIAPTTAATP
jgi:tetratricopeptide (TPR) repeat protein